MRKTIIAFLFLFCLKTGNAQTVSQEKLPRIRSNVGVISIKDGDRMRKNYWTLAPEVNPDIYHAELINGRAHRVTFITDVDSISFLVEEGKKYDFIIEWGEKLCYTQIVGTRFIPAAVFDEQYQTAHKGKIFVEIPEAYELVNIAIAMTPTAIEDKTLVYQNSEYYSRMRRWFDKFRDHPLLEALESEIKKNFNAYFSLKMDGYSFEFDEKGKIVQSKVYDRTGWESTNSLRPFLEKLQSFSDTTNFRHFYKENASTYREQIEFYRDTANIAEMKRWLDKNFPASSGYGCYKVIFSPLVAYNQSSHWIESNGFRELYAHVNFPYLEDLTRYSGGVKMSEEAQNIFRGNIVFTELNHGYINPEADKYADRVASAVSNRHHWVEKSRPDSYYGGSAVFNEYMNWGLVTLRIVDYVPREEQDALIARVVKMMTERRGFLQFAAYDEFLIDLYRNRKAGQTLADLYPQIIQWFEDFNLP